MNTEKIVLTYKNKKKPERICHMATDANGHKILHGEDTWFMVNGRIKEHRFWRNDKREGLDVMNYLHKENYDKRYLLRTFKANEVNGVQVYFFKH